MQKDQEIALLGFASSVAASDADCALGPWYLYYHPELFANIDLRISWESIIKITSLVRGKYALPFVAQGVSELGNAVLDLIKNKQNFCVIGGDHSCGIGTWSAVAAAYKAHGDIGLIWIDAHMDSHTPETSNSQNIHGMPVAHLLGEGVDELCNLFDDFPKIKPSNICLIGIRSYQEAEALLLKRLGVKVFFMDEVFERGINTVFQEALAIVSKNTCGVGLSIDLDGIDPIDAPGVGNPEPDGISGAMLLDALQTTFAKFNVPFLGLEIAEYNPLHDEDAKTAKLLVNIIASVMPIKN